MGDCRARIVQHTALLCNSFLSHGLFLSASVLFSCALHKLIAQLVHTNSMPPTVLSVSSLLYISPCWCWHIQSLDNRSEVKLLRPLVESVDLSVPVVIDVEGMDVPEKQRRLRSSAIRERIRKCRCLLDGPQSAAICVKKKKWHDADDKPHTAIHTCCNNPHIIPLF